ncbi:hypothetical protein sscle_15g106220 [Sclerotinia sclerotiorum 1980 UF-70]|uniref:Uncharacterized protein n=1 Tax=Sclerotinia sclerotiorum (strain ATCC 18683 / 1980 / Ss-1) TaxID=665079 RepID=A0A1D9QM00_SCLS1|nr:hypothetical protein sscle_15g106220 [Sclerotinia sclerotiorum 1980 UF-70]
MRTKDKRLGHQEQPRYQCIDDNRPIIDIEVFRDTLDETPKQSQERGFYRKCTSSDSAYECIKEGYWIKKLINIIDGTMTRGSVVIARDSMVTYRTLYKHAVAATRHNRPNHRKASSSFNEPNASSLFTVRDITVITATPNSTPADICFDINIVIKHCFISVGL